MEAGRHKSKRNNAFQLRMKYHHDNPGTHQQHKLCLLDTGRDKTETIKLWQQHKQLRGHTLTQHKITST